MRDERGYRDEAGSHSVSIGEADAMMRANDARRAQPTRLFFTYINHRGDLHSYLVEPIELVFGPCQCFRDDPDRPVWHIRANVIERDHEPRPGERSFALIKMSHEIRETAA